MSVVVASVSGEPALVRCLDSLLPQANETEVIVATALEQATVDRLGEWFPTVRWLSVPGASVFRLRSLGLAQAHGRYVALTEDHCTFAATWLAALTEACRRGATVVGGPAENGLVRSWHRALYLFEYSAWLPTGPADRVEILCGVNVAYERDALWSCASVWQEVFHENEVHDALRRRGHRLLMAKDARVRTHLAMSPFASLAHLFEGGAAFGTYRRQHSGSIFARLWVLAIPLVPLVHLWRIVGRVARSGWTATGHFLQSLPELVCLIAAWTAGEAAGYLGIGPRRQDAV